ncbi:LysR family transcriptional regulator [Ligilactobacillus equi]|uniref:LysR family transcriptional regulator n=1 Tax=Ligilactobacillus equi DPC 6820 TaxID=1392007 RepID=V7HYZ2_9LACO|nr:LysR family transcriptional regulator [Ligilactobacillus equi]ETA74261.1 LysR family transcriptional regulator [Ligilactobacillus equi DPC 6820]
MNLTQLEYFRQVGHSLNISQTARKLHVTQPTISRSLKELERDLGAELFTRSGKNLVLNEEGQVFLLTAERILDELEYGVQKVASLKEEEVKRIIFEVKKTSPILVTLIKQLHYRYPQVKIVVKQENHPTNELNNYNDYVFEFSGYPISGKQNVLVLTEKIGILVSQKNPLAQRECISLMEFNRELACLEDSPIQEIIDGFFVNQSCKIPTLITTGDRKMIFEIVAADLALSLVPECSWRTYLTNDVKIIDGDFDLKREIYVSYRRRMDHFQQEVLNEIVRIIKNYGR